MFPGHDGDGPSATQAEQRLTARFTRRASREKKGRTVSNLYEIFFRPRGQI